MPFICGLLGLVGHPRVHTTSATDIGRCIIPDIGPVHPYHMMVARHSHWGVVVIWGYIMGQLSAIEHCVTKHCVTHGREESKLVD